MTGVVDAVSRRWEAWVFQPRPLLWTAVARIVLAGYATFYLLLSDRNGFLPRTRDAAALPDGVYEPLPLLDAATLFTGWRPTEGVLVAMFWVAVVAGAAAVVGLLTNAALVVHGVLLGFLQLHLYSYGEYHHPETLIVLGVALVALAPAGRVLSADAWIRHRQLFPHGPWETHPFAGWPLLTLHVLLALAYLSAGLTKLLAGFDWLNGWTLQYHLGRDGAIHGVGAAEWLSGQHQIAIALSFLAVGVELGYVATLWRPRWLLVLGPVMASFHLGIWILQRAPFFGYILLNLLIAAPWIFRPPAGSVRSAQGAGDDPEAVPAGG